MVATFDEQKLVTNLTWNATSEWLAVEITRGGPIDLWHVPTKTSIRPFPDTFNTGYVAFSPDGTLVAATLVQDLVIWSIPEQRIIQQIHHEFDPADLAAMETPRPFPPFATLNQVAFTADSQQVLAYDDLNGYVWDIASGQKRATVPGQEGFVHPHDPHLFLTTRVTVNKTRTVMLWDRTQNAPRWSQQNYGTRGFSPDGQYVVSFTHGHYGLWDTTTGQHAMSIEAPADMLQFSPDGTQLITAVYGRSVSVWSVPDGALIQTVMLPSRSPVLALRSTPDNRFLLISQGYDPGGDFGSPHETPTAETDRVIQVWRVADGQLVQTLTAHSDAVNVLAFSPNGQWLASGSADKTVRLWTYDP